MTYMEGGVRIAALLGSCLAILCASHPAAGQAETYQQYLQRLDEICSTECLQPRDVLRTVRKREADERTSTPQLDVAAILDIASVAQWNGKFLLLADTTNLADFNALGQRTPGRFRPVTQPNQIVVEMDRETFFDLLNLPMPGDEPAIDEAGNIIVSQDRFRNFSEPTLAKLRTMFRNRRIVVRGEPRLEVPFIGGRRTFREKKVFLQLESPDDLVILPRYDREGQPVPGGEFEGFELLVSQDEE